MAKSNKDKKKVEKAGYVDGFVLVVPKKKLKTYEKMAKEAGQVWMKHGALEYVECVGEDLNPDMGPIKALPFTKLAQTKPSDTVIFSFITYKSKKHRDQVNAKVMKEMEPHMDEKMEIPWEWNKFSQGGFKTIVSL